MSDIRKNIDDITRLKAVLDGTERFVGRDDTSDFKTLLSAIATYIGPLITGAFTPVGGYIMADTTFPNFPALDSIYHPADGTVISDSESLFYLYRSRNFNGADVVLTLDWTADAGGAYATVSTYDIPALNIGDWVSGSGIAADSIVTDYDESTGVIVISDVSASGEIESTFTNDGLYPGGGEGSLSDEMHGHRHNTAITTDGAAPFLGSNFGTGATTTVRTYNTTSINATQEIMITGDPVTDETNGTPRLGTRTRPHTRKLQFAMRIK